MSAITYVLKHGLLGGLLLIVIVIVVGLIIAGRITF